jgi:hypothetical protein
MRKKTRQSVEQGQELSDVELEQAVGGTGLQQASADVGEIVAPAGGGSAMQAPADNAEMLKVQMAMQRENTSFSSISNVLKTKHDTAKNSISNIR